MDISLEWQNLFSRYFDSVIIVEGKKDAAALNALGFEKVYTINQTGVSLRERIEDITHGLSKKDIVCILTDFDKKGKQLYFLIFKEMQSLGVKLDNSLRGILGRMGISHIEGLDTFVNTHDCF